MENCLTYALRKWRWWRSSDHLDIRKSHWGAFPHFSVMYERENGDLVKCEYVPIKPRPQWLPPLFFRGVEKITYYRKESVDYAGQSDQFRPMESGAPARADLLE